MRRSRTITAGTLSAKEKGFDQSHMISPIDHKEFETFLSTHMGGSVKRKNSSIGREEF